MDAQNIEVSESFCDLATRPLAIKKCRNSPCKYIVVTGDSSQVRQRKEVEDFHYDSGAGTMRDKSAEARGS